MFIFLIILKIFPDKHYHYLLIDIPVFLLVVTNGLLFARR